MLAAGTLIATAAQAARRHVAPRQAARIGMSLAMLVAGVTHWVRPLPFLQHLPPWVPAPELLIFITAITEVVLGAALLLPQPWRRWAGIALAAYLVAVFPGNVYVAVAGVDVEGQPGGVHPWVRLPLQVLFMAWALWSTRPDTATASPHPAALRPPSTAVPGDHQRTVVSSSAAAPDLLRTRPTPRVSMPATRITAPA